MLTTDIALLHDESYLKISKEFAADQSALDDAFSRAWYKLTSRDMGPVSRCRGNDVPTAQPFQNPLPPTPAILPNFEAVRADIRKLLYKSMENLVSDRSSDDYAGGCNGAKIRFAPQKDWPMNTGVDKIIAVLESMKTNGSSRA
ncbi:catalase peroxidase hpi [Plasmopara halstedii]|uniref:Catalase peroxidase hpi n=1 Tax=Plasmopara halstedii TaxID=4781 RepID=A0A0P1ADB4_PLAHL|nr:catalase peroxidase hpi [Plasmopara halstedii]CEG38948.1 catalase peroxidase hpi [Plasmopara halstedii]|eukprot:XP_024575317.1 catalase peroxidase hpi [Plasmopara halstedii]